jgi:hypothetical protein
MTQEVVFNTLEQANTKQEADYNVFCNGVTEGKTTTAWAIPRQKIDGKWAYPIYEPSDYTGYTLEEYDETNYPTGE